MKKDQGDTPGTTRLKKDLKDKNLEKCYVLFGEEDYLRLYYFKQIKKQLLDKLTEDFNYHRLTTENFSLQLLADSLEALPMMGERTLVHLDDVPLFELGEDDMKTLIDLLSDLPEHCCLVMTYGNFKPDKRKKLWKVLEKNAVLAEFLYQRETELRPWIVRHFKARGKNISTQLCNELLDLCGCSMSRLQGEIEKICAYSGTDTIVRSDLTEVVEPTLEAAVFDIINSIADKKYDKALRTLQILLKQQEEPIVIVAAIGTQLRHLREAKYFHQLDEVMKICSMGTYAASKTLTQARRFSERFCDRAVILCRDTDYQIKTSYDDKDRLAEMLILKLIEEARRD